MSRRAELHKAGKKPTAMEGEGCRGVWGVSPPHQQPLLPQPHTSPKPQPPPRTPPPPPPHESPRRPNPLQEPLLAAEHLAAGEPDRAAAALEARDADAENARPAVSHTPMPMRGGSWQKALWRHWPFRSGVTPERSDEEAAGGGSWSRGSSLSDLRAGIYHERRCGYEQLAVELLSSASQALPMTLLNLAQA